MFCTNGKAAVAVMAAVFLCSCQRANDDEVPASKAAVAVVIPSGLPAAAAVRPFSGASAIEGSWTGQITAAVFDDFAGKASVTKWYLRGSGRDMELSAPARFHLQPWLGQNVRVQGEGTGKLIAVKALTPSLELSQPAASSEAGAPAALQCSTLGDQKTAVLLMNQPSAPFQLSKFPVSYWRDKYFSAGHKSANSFFMETSYGQTSVSGEVFGPFDFDRDYSCNEVTEYRAAAIDAARSAGVDFAPYTRVSVVLTPVGACAYNGIADTGCVGPDERMPNEYSITAIVTGPDTPSSHDFSDLISHEMGHNLGLGHSQSLDFASIPLGALDYSTVSWEKAGQGAAGETAVQEEYGDLYSTMGGKWMHHGYSARDKLALGWMPLADYQEVTGAGDFELTPFELSRGLRAIRVLRDPRNFSWLWLEYRQPIGDYDSDISRVPSNLFEGALVRYEGDDANPTALLGPPPLKLLHFNPSETPNPFWLSTMTAGQSWSDPYTLLNLAVNQGDSSELSVSARIDEPCAQLTATYAEPDLSIQVSAPDSCIWQASTAADWLTLTSAGSGQGNGSIVYRAAANPDARQRRAYVTVQRQSILVAQKGTGIFVHPQQNPHIRGNEARITALVEYPGGTSYAVISSDIGGCGLRASHVAHAAPSLHLQGTAGQIYPGSPDTISNDHCTLSGAGSEIEVSGGQIRVVWDVKLSATVGSFPVSVSALDDSDFAGPLVSGTWTVKLPPPIPKTSTALVAVAGHQQFDLSWNAGAPGGRGLRGGGGALNIGTLLLLALSALRHRRKSRSGV